MRIIPRAFLCAVLSGILFISCKHGQTGADADPFAEAGFKAYENGFEQHLEDYHLARSAENAHVPEGKASLYIDFSSGIYQALTAKDNLSLLTNVYNSLPTNALDIFKLSSDTIISMERADIDAEVTDPKKYNEIYAPITRAVAEIVSKKNDAILVTDFEEYKNKAEITNIAYLKDLFEDWLLKGNSIQFFISEYKENTTAKRLFFTVFSYGRISDESLLKRVENSPLISGLTRYDLSSRAFSFSQQYDTEKSGGIFYDPSGKSENEKNVLGFEKDTYLNGLKKSNAGFEFYSFGLDWKTISEQREAYKGQFDYFFRKLFIDISNEDSYRIDALSVKVTDVTGDFEYFAKCQEATKHKPHTDKGSNGEDKFKEDEKDLIALNCYEPNGKIKDKWVYSPQPVTELPEIFAFNNTLFNNTTASSGREKAELSVVFDPKFDLKNIPSTARLLRVDILVNKATASTANVKLKKFSWQSTSQKGAQNTALLASVTNTLVDPRIKPDQHVIYSYYIKTATDN